MNYREEIFTRYGQPSKEGEFRIPVYYFKLPESIEDSDNIVWYDKHASDLISRMQELTQYLAEYRKDLAKRYAQLETMPYTLRLSLKRRRWNNGITYTVKVVKVYSDGTEATAETKEYSGKERHAAIKYFNDFKKSHPNIESVMDIEKGKWER